MRYPMILRAGTWLVAFSVIAFTACDQAPTNTATLGGVELAAAAGGWDDKVTAGGDATAGGTDFSFSASASGNETSDWGEMQYSRADGSLAFHADVDCLWVSEDLQQAAVAGPVKSIQAGSSSANYAWAEFSEGGTGSGDQLRVRLQSGPPSGDRCGWSGSTPGTYVDGNVNIRSK